MSVLSHVRGRKIPRTLALKPTRSTQLYFKAWPSHPTHVLLSLAGKAGGRKRWQLPRPRSHWTCELLPLPHALALTAVSGAMPSAARYGTAGAHDNRHNRPRPQENREGTVGQLRARCVHCAHGSRPKALALQRGDPSSGSAWRPEPPAMSNAPHAPGPADPTRARVRREAPSEIEGRPPCSSLHADVAV